MKEVITQYKKDFKSITKHYKKLIKLTKRNIVVDSNNEWLIDNYYNILINNENLIKTINSSKVYYILKNYNSKVLEIINEIYFEFNFKVENDKLLEKINEKLNLLKINISYEELNLLPTILYFTTLKYLGEIYETEAKFLSDILKVDKIRFKLEKEPNIKKHVQYFKNIEQRPVFLEKIIYLAQEKGDSSSSFINDINNYLESKNYNLIYLLNSLHEKRAITNIVVVNLWESLKLVLKLEIENVYEKVSKSEQILLKDSNYKIMTPSSKQLYRNQIIKLSKNSDEYLFVLKLFDKSLKEKEHIGFYLFKKPNLKLRSISYLTIILILSIITTLFFNMYFIDNKFIGFFILFLPNTELIIQIVNQIIIRTIKPMELPKLDYTKNIPLSASTMVVIPTIVKTEKKVKELFEALETYYISNNHKNIYFTLLADGMQNEKEIHESDKEVNCAGINECLRLNKKYGRDVFYFIHRRRFYNKAEGAWLGIERKRGALNHFNLLLLNKLTEEDKNKYFQVHNFDNFSTKIKYVLTLDTDTKVFVNTIANLVGTMDHPLHTPVLNKQENKVIAGYGIMQPKISLDIESTNRSIYSQLFVGIGGFNVYNSTSPNLYQDLFEEGSFVGKGIYNLEIYNKILLNKFPDNLILSHDLIEGNYLRCGYVSDVEVYDDFPAKYLADASRKHRWARGDTQILGWLLNIVKVKDGKEKNTLSLIQRWKIFDNIRRSFLDLSYLTIILFACFFNAESLIIFPLLILLIISLPIIFYIFNKPNYKYLVGVRKKRYSQLLYGGISLLIRCFITFSLIPYNAYLYVDATIRSLYRMFISKKNLLNWITAEEAEKTIKNNLLNYFLNFKINYLFGFIFLILGIIENYLCIIFFGIIFFMSPILLFLISKKFKKQETKNKEYLTSIAQDTWKYFAEFLNEKNNYLIPDNYQIDRTVNEDYKTSPTNIGMSLVSIISAYELEFISLNQALRNILGILETIDKLDKWNGHLYNWYNIYTLEKLYPYYVSSVDSANLIAAIYTVKSFSRDKDEKIYNLCKKIIDETDFKVLYTENNVFSIGYNTIEEKLSVYNYNKFASESRILSYVAIASGQIPSIHWFCLDKTLTKYKKEKGLTSWSGTSFEYYMPFIFIKNFKNTLLDESYNFAYFCQKEYMKKIDEKLPWGISESAYASYDEDSNYMYKAFGTPYLKIQDKFSDHTVISPYASIIAIDFAKDLKENLLKYKNLDMYGKYGFYEAYDDKRQKSVKAYFAHHQGMILGSITNYVKNNVIQNYFHKNVEMKAFEILLKEKAQLRCYINNKIDNYRSYSYNKEKIANDIRVVNSLSSRPEISVLSNGNYTLLINERGNGFSRYKLTQLNRYRKITEQDYGMFLYIKDLKTNKAWSNTYAPMNIEPEKYEVIFATDRIKFLNKTNDILTTTEIIVDSKYNAEIRKYVFANNSEEKKELQLTTYNEPIINRNVNDVAHRTFQNLFIRSEFVSNSLIIKREQEGKTRFVGNRIYCFEDSQEIEYETNRINFIGRNRNTDNPIALERKLLSSSGDEIDPIMSLRTSIEIEPGAKKTIYFVNGFAKTKEQILDLLNYYNSLEHLENSYELVTITNNRTTKILNSSGPDMRLYNIMLNYLYQTSKINVDKNRRENMKLNTLGQDSLWKFGISGDYPIVLLDLKSLNSMGLLDEVLKAYEYFKAKSLYIDVVILNQNNDVVEEIVKNHLRKINAININNSNSSIYTINKEDISNEEHILLKEVSRLFLDSDEFLSLNEYIEFLQNDNVLVPYQKSFQEKNKKYKVNGLSFDNEYGGFSKNGKEYIITNPNTPTPWSNILANKNFGSLVTNNGNGFTYYRNSREFKISSWTNDIVINDKSEGIKINGINFNSGLTTHGFGYSVFKNSSKYYDGTLTEFVDDTENAKYFVFNIKNIIDKNIEFDLEFWINPVLGVDEEKTARHIYSDFNDENNMLILKNVYNKIFKNVNILLSCSEKINEYSIDKSMVKSISTKINLSKDEEKTVIFVIKATEEELKVNCSVKETFKKLENTKKYWKNILEKIQVKTPDESFDFMMNGWYLYQAIACRIYAKSGFYQVGGAYGYRDQLQDASNLTVVNEDMSREQILSNAKHQFKEGDVLHWWHKDLSFGLRSKYKDDYLWLIYATMSYIEKTGDIKILDELVNFVEGPTLENNEAEKGINFYYSTTNSTLLDHLFRSLNLAMNSIGSHGIPLMGGGDWNDGMNKVGVLGTGESVWLGFFLYIVLDKFIKVLNLNNIEIDKKFELFNNELKENIIRNCYDGEYYLRAFFDNGDKLGSCFNKECKIDLLSQSFSILSKIASDSQIQSILKNVEEKLVDKNLKIVKLLTPAFDNPVNDPGYIKNYPAGIRENGGQYTHSVAWYIMALCQTNKNNQAYEYYQMINPINRTLSKNDVLNYALEPYVIAADIYSSEKYPGRGGWSWYTGSAAWFYKVGLETILGFNKKGNKLYITPSIPDHFNSYEIKYVYKNTEYNIKINNKKIEETEYIVNDKKEKFIKLIDDGGKHKVVVNLGREIKNDEIRF